MATHAKGKSLAPSDAMDTSSTISRDPLDTISAKFDLVLARLEKIERVQAERRPAPTAASTATRSSVPSGPAASTSVHGSLELLANYSHKFSGAGIDWPVHAWEAIMRPRVEALPDNCHVSDVVFVLLGLLEGDAKKAMASAMPLTIDAFFEQLSDCFPASEYEIRVERALQAGTFFSGIAKHQYANMAMRVLQSLPPVNNSAVKIAQALMGVDPDAFVQLQLDSDSATIDTIGEWCEKVQDLINLKQK
ncbi:hypothetical protein IWW52_003271, partial [Coemansia sp. RSA 2704]